MGYDINEELLIARGLPSPIGDGVASVKGKRHSRDRAAFVRNLIVTRHALADQGSTWAMTNPTPGTTIPGPILNAFADTTPWFLFKNNYGLTDPKAKRTFIASVKLIPTVAPASAVSAQWALKIEPSSANALKYTSGGAQLYNTSPGAGLQTNLSESIGNKTLLWYASTTILTVVASSASALLIGRGSVRGSVPVVGDELEIRFGDADGGSGSPGAGGSRQVSQGPDFVLTPQDYGMLYIWFPSNATTGLSYEFQITGYEDY